MTLLVRPAEEVARAYRAIGAWRSDSLVEDLDRWATSTPDAPVLVADREHGGLLVLTYGELAAHVERFAAALTELGVEPGDVVSLQLPNWWQAPALALACWRVGAVLAPVLPTIRGRELERMLARVLARVFVTTDCWDGHDHAAMAAELASRLPALRHRVVLRHPAGRGEVAPDEIDFAGFFEEGEWAPTPPRASDPDAVALVVFTSGTTGEPKAALRTLNNGYAQILLELPADGSKMHNHTPQSVMHIAGLSSITHALITGGSTLLTDRWVPARTARLLAERRIETLTLVPSFLAELLDAVRAERIELPALRRVTAVGAEIPRQLLADTADLLGLPLGSAWGMTEGGQTCTSPQDPPGWALRSIGRPGLGTEVELRASVPGLPVDARNPGQLMIRGASVCLATMGRDSGEVRVLAEHDDGWYDTGDLAVPDGRGGYRLAGRAVDRVGGAFMIPVADVEEALRSHQDIVDVAIVGHRDNTEGCAVLVSSAPLTVRDVHAYLADLGMTQWYWPTMVKRVAALPRNAMRKVEKARLRAWLSGGAAHEPTALEPARR